MDFVTITNLIHLGGVLLLLVVVVILIKIGIL